MPALNPTFAPTVTFTRPTEDADGNKGSTVLGDNQVVVSDNTRQVFMPRGLDRRAGDQFIHNLRTYTLTGMPRGDQDQPFTGDDFGWVAFNFEAGWLQEAQGVK